MGDSIYQAMGGRPAVLALAAAWHERCLADEVVAHAFSHGFDDHHTDRLAAYWAETLGGPADYSSTLGTESDVVRMHSGNGEHREMDRRAEECFAGALEDTGIARDDRLSQTLRDWFHWATGEMAAYSGSQADVPPDLPMPRWTWSGPTWTESPTTGPG